MLFQLWLAQFIRFTLSFNCSSQARETHSSGTIHFPLFHFTLLSLLLHRIFSCYLFFLFFIFSKGNSWSIVFKPLLFENRISINIIQRTLSFGLLAWLFLYHIMRRTTKRERQRTTHYPLEIKLTCLTSSKVVKVNIHHTSIHSELFCCNSAIWTTNYYYLVHKKVIGSNT